MVDCYDYGVVCGVMGDDAGFVLVLWVWSGSDAEGVLAYDVGVVLFEVVVDCAADGVGGHCWWWVVSHCLSLGMRLGSASWRVVRLMLVVWWVVGMCVIRWMVLGWPCRR